MTPALQDWRKQQRDALLVQRMAIGHERRDRLNAQITARLLAALQPARGTIIAGYWPIKGEFDPRFVMRAWRSGGARTALPVVLRKATPLQFREWWPGMATVRGVYNLPVPQEGAVVTPQLALIPPIGLDAFGYRLGYGAGYYDRTLAALAPQPLKIAVAFELARITTIEPQPHDVAMDFVATEKAWYRVTADGLVQLDTSEAGAQLAQALGSACKGNDGPFADPER